MFQILSEILHNGNYAAHALLSRISDVMSKAAADGKFEFLKDHSQRFEPRQQWLSMGGDCVTQQANQRPAIVLGQVEGAFSRQRVTTRHPGHLSAALRCGDQDST
jgi:hypothetical protein